MDHSALRGAAWSSSLPLARSLEASELAVLTSALAARPQLWRSLVHHDPLVRWYERLALTEAVEVWLIGWWPGQHTPLHDHGGAAGALAVVSGSLEETFAGPLEHVVRPWVLRQGSVLELPASIVHRVGNPGPAPATSIHAYSPPGRGLREHADVSPAGVVAAAASEPPHVRVPR
jgi:predicted metal-dependent enzyme (double-stranded beta helix superfamily)